MFKKFRIIITETFTGILSECCIFF